MSYFIDYFYIHKNINKYAYKINYMITVNGGIFKRNIIFIEHRNFLKMKN